jgi:transcriptional regulator with AAA-type ATPase domain/tetratricopeptide (TPR) repeat protein
MATPLEGLRGESGRMVAVRAQVAQLLARQASTGRLPPVLILGETGTGKGLLARAIHQAGPRRDGPFVGVNCAAIPETLLEAELFGYERGAFTDARHAKPGLFQSAHGGTLFLDEIGLLPAALQAKLLNVLEGRVVRRLGSTRSEPVDLALVAATSVELKRAVSDGRFREDLYHRLAVITLELPPLRDRGSDILALADHFLLRACADYGLSSRALTPEAREMLAAYRWPGNVRELANVMERAALFSDTEAITAASLEFLTGNEARRDDAGAVAAAGSLDDALRARIETALRENGGNIRRTAVDLGISRNTLRARMDKYGLRSPGTAPSRAGRGARPSPAQGDHRAPTYWERRHLAFLRARLLRPSAVDVVSALEMVGDKVRAFGGRIEESSPTGVIAAFGLEPVDNAPSHAALAALAIRHAAAHARAVGRGGADVVMAIHCSDHVVSRRDSTYLIGIDGKAATWSILEALAAADVPGAIVGSSAVAPFLVRRFALERIQEDGRNTWLVLRREEASAGWKVTRFIGRTSELDALRQAASLAEQQHGQIVAIVGEAGVGKSRLAYEAVRQFHGWLLLSAGGAPYARETSYAPLVELLKTFCHVQDVDSPSEVRERVARALPVAADAQSVQPPILDLLGVLPLDDAFHKVDPIQRRRRTHDGVRQMLLAASVAEPVCLIIEDLHWIDAETQAVLDGLVNGLPGARVLLLVNYRPEYQHPWSSKSYYRQVGLNPLPVEGVGELLDALLGDDPGLVPLKRLLVEQGNPFFLEETVRMLMETNVLTGERGRYALTHPVEAIEVAPTVQALLTARIDRLPPEDRHLMQVASVVGKDVPFTLLQAVADLPDEALRRGLGHLQTAEFLYETRLVPDPEYTFKHALTQQVAYDGLLAEQRCPLHAQVVAAIERTYPDRLAEHVEELAHHAVRGGLHEKAVGYFRQAGLRAMARAAYREAILHLEQALAALRRLPETRETTELTIDIRLDLRTALNPLGDQARMDELVREAEGLARRLGDQHRLGRIASFMAQQCLVTGDYDEAVRLGQEALAIARTRGDCSIEVVATTFLGVTYAARGAFKDAITFLERNVALEGDLRFERFGATGIQSAFSGAKLADVLAQLGRFDEAIVHAEAAVRIAEGADHPLTLSWALFYLGRAHLCRGDFLRATRALERGLDLCRTWQFAVGTPLFAATLGATYALAGRADEALPLIAGAVEEFRRRPSHSRPALILLCAGVTFLSAGRIDEAKSHAREALLLTRRLEARGSEAHGLCLAGDVASTGGAEDAPGYYREALALADELGMRPLVAHCHLGLARLCRRAGDHARAREHLTTATTMYREMRMNWRLEKAELEPVR